MVNPKSIVIAVKKQSLPEIIGSAVDTHPAYRLDGNKMVAGLEKENEDDFGEPIMTSEAVRVRKERNGKG